MAEAAPKVGVLIVDNDKVLLITRKAFPNGSYQLPGGQVDIENHESPKEAAKRELARATGLSISHEDMIRVPDSWSAAIEKLYGTQIFSFICFVCTNFTGVVTETETASPKWFPFSDVHEVDIAPNALDAIEAGYLIIAG